MKIWCETCDGTGELDNSTMFEQDTKRCSDCKGKGYIEQEVTEDLQLVINDLIDFKKVGELFAYQNASIDKAIEVISKFKTIEHEARVGRAFKEAINYYNLACGYNEAETEICSEEELLEWVGGK